MPQSIASVSSMEADIVWIRQLFKDIALERTRPTKVKVLVDNQSAPPLAMNPTHHRQSKHIDIMYHRIYDIVVSKAIQLIYVSMTELS